MIKKHDETIQYNPHALMIINVICVAKDHDHKISNGSKYMVIWLLYDVL